MANTNLRQTKRRKVVMDLEATLGTYETPDSNSLVLPVTGEPAFAASRGTRIIDRTNTIDGYHGDVDGYPGSWAWTAAFDVEVHEVATRVPYWAQMLLTAGHAGETNNDPPGVTGEGIVLYPTVNTLTANANLNGALSPCTASLTHVKLNNGTDWAQRVRGVTATTTLTFTAGEIVTMNYASVGLVEGDSILDTTDGTLSDNGATTNTFVTPFRFINAFIELTDLDTGDPVVTPAVTSCVLTSAGATPDVLDAQEEYGFGISPVFWDTSPTITLSFADDSDNDEIIMDRLFTGKTFSFILRLETVSGRYLILEVPRMQFTDVAFANVSGFLGVNVTAKITRVPGIPASDFAGALYRIYWVGPPP